MGAAGVSYLTMTFFVVSPRPRESKLASLTIRTTNTMNFLLQHACTLSGSLLDHHMAVIIMKASVEPSPQKPLRRKSKSMEELAGATQVAEEERRRPSRRRSAGPTAIGGITNSMSHSLIRDRSSRGIAGTEGGVNISFIDKKGLGAAAIGDILSDFSYEDDGEEKENDENDDDEEQDEVKSITEDCLLDASEVTNDTNDEKKDNECCSMQSSTRSLNSSLRNVRRDRMRTQRSQRSVTFLLDPGDDSEDEEKK